MADIDYPASWYAATRDASSRATQPERPGRGRRCDRGRRLRRPAHGAPAGHARPQGRAGRAAAHRLGRLGPQRRLRRAGLCPAHGRPDRAAGRGPCPPALRPVAARRGNRARVAEGDGATRHPDGLGPALGLAHRPGAGLRRAIARAGRRSSAPRSSPGRPTRCAPCSITARYFQGLHDAQGFQIHPLNLALALAADAERRGVQVHEATEARSLERRGTEWQLRTAMGEITARHVVLAGNADLGRIHRARRARSCRWRPMSR